MKTLILSLAILMLMATSALSAIPKGFENYPTWPRFPCMEMVIKGEEYHVHLYDKDNDGRPNAAELYKAPNYAYPTLYMFDINRNGLFDASETFNTADLFFDCIECN